MEKILFICSGGMSTALIGTKLEEVAKKNGSEFKAWAKGAGELQAELDKEEVSIVLVAPQIKHKLKDLKAICDSKGIKCAPIAPNMYVPMDMAIKKLYDFTIKELAK